MLLTIDTDIAKLNMKENNELILIKNKYEKLKKPIEQKYQNEMMKLNQNENAELRVVNNKYNELRNQLLEQEKYINTLIWNQTRKYIIFVIILTFCVHIQYTLF
jgi:hypothetical protein